MRSDVAESMNRDACAGDVYSMVAGRQRRDVSNTVSGCFLAALGAAKLERLSGDDRGSLPVQFCIFVEYPGHMARVGIQVRRGNILVDTKDWRKLLRVSSC